MKRKVFIFLVLLALLFSGLGGQAANAEGESPHTVPQVEKYFPFGTSMNWGGYREPRPPTRISEVKVTLIIIWIIMPRLYWILPG